MPCFMAFVGIREMLMCIFFFFGGKNMYSLGQFTCLMCSGCGIELFPFRSNQFAIEAHSNET